MFHASSQAPFASRRSTDREALSECFSQQGNLHRKRRKLGSEGKRPQLNLAQPDPTQPDPTQPGQPEIAEADSRLSDTDLSDIDLIDDYGANNPTIDTQVNRSDAFEHTPSKDAENALILEDRSAASQLSQLQQCLLQQQQLRRIEHKLRDSLNLSAIYGVAVVEAAALFKAQQTVLMKYSAQAQRWTLAAQYCQNQSIAWQRSCSLVQEEFPDLTRQLFQGETLQIFADQPLPTTETRQWLAYQPGSWLLVPVPVLSLQTTAQPVSDLSADSFSALHSNAHWGIMALALPAGKTWSADDIACAESLVHELSAAIAHAEQYQALLSANANLQKLALSDGLTGLANRRRFDKHLGDEWQRLAREQRPLSLILCDLDHFKQYNDTFGHPAGDRCLTKVAAALKRGPRRPADLVARYGGEEFAIILPNTDTKGAWRIAQKLHSNIRALKIAHTADEERPYVTVTMGVSTIIPGHDATAQVLVQAADLALYHAKKQGRDRTYVHAYYNTVSEETKRQTSEENLSDAQKAEIFDDSLLRMMPPEA